MTTPPVLDDVIARRTLRLIDPTGTVAPIDLSFARPVPADGGDSYVCRFQVKGFGSDAVVEAMGADAVQALLLAFQVAGVRFQGTPPGTRVEWLEGLSDLGLPARIEYVECPSTP